MKYLKTYRLYESEVVTDEEIIADIKGCFLEVSDMIGDRHGFGVRVVEFSKRKGKTMKNLNIKADYEVMVIPEILNAGSDERYDASILYRPTNMSIDMIREIENSVSLATGTLDLKFRYAAIEYANAYDHSKGEMGPGLTIKKFSPDGVIPTDKFQRGSYNIDYLFDFLRSKGDKVRWIKLFFDK